MLYLTYAMMLLHTFVGLILIAVILLQRGRGGGLAGAFGGMGGQSAFGTKAGDLFTKITIVLATVWIVLGGVCVLMASSAKTRAGRESFTNDTPAVEIKKAGEDQKTDKSGDDADMDNDGELPAPKDPPATKTDVKPGDTPAEAATKVEEGAVKEKPAEKAVDPEAKPEAKPAAKADAKPEEKPAAPAEPVKKDEGDAPQESAEKKD